MASLSSPLALNIKNSGQVSLHLYFPRLNDTECPELLIPDDMYSLLSVNITETEDFSDILPLYPINIGRNIARAAVKTRLFISNDIEQFFTPNFEHFMYNLGKKILIE